MPYVTVAQAVTITGRSKSAIYRLTSSGEVPSHESTAGIVVDLGRLNRALATPRRGRPPGTSKHAA